MCARSDSLESTNRWCCAYSFSSQAELNTLKLFQRIAAHKKTNDRGNNNTRSICTHGIKWSEATPTDKTSTYTYTHTYTNDTVILRSSNSAYWQNRQYICVWDCDCVPDISFVLHTQQNASCTCRDLTHSINCNANFGQTAARWCAPHMCEQWANKRRWFSLNWRCLLSAWAPFELSDPALSMFVHYTARQVFEKT